MSAAIGVMFLTKPFGQIAAGPLINEVGSRMVILIAATGCLIGAAPFAIYAGRHRRTDDPLSLAFDAEFPKAPGSV